MRLTFSMHKSDDTGSLPLAMMVTVFCIVLSLLALSGLALEASRSSGEQASQVSAAASDSGLAVAAQDMSAQGRSLCTAPYAAPTTYRPSPTGQSGYRWWVDKTDIGKGKVNIVVQGNSGNPAFPAVTSQSASYEWNSASKRWQITGRKGNEVYPYPTTDNFFPVTTPARYTPTPANRSMGTNLDSARVPDLASAPPAANDAIVSDGKYVWLAGEFTSVTGSNGTFSRPSGLVKFDTTTGTVEDWAPTLSSGAAVNSMILTGDDVVIAGTFTSVNGTARGRIAKVNKTTGVVNASFNSGTVGADVRGATDTINDVVYDSSRNIILAAGAFSTWIGAPSNIADRFVGLDPTTGLPVATNVQADPNFTAPITRIVVTGNGTVIAGGDLYTSGALRRKLVKVAVDGTVTDTGMDVTRGGYTGTLNALAVNADYPDRLVAGFGYANSGNVPRMVRMYKVSDGSTLWTTATGNDVYTIAWNAGRVYASIPNGTNFTQNAGGATSSAAGETWTAATPPTASWRKIAYGNGLFVAVANGTSGNRIITSPDGITWTARTTPSTYALWGITYGNGMFVAGALSNSPAGNRILTSTDGITWTPRATPATADASNWVSLTYGNGRFVALASTGTVGVSRAMYSDDGITWNFGSGAPENNWGGLTYGNGRFVAVAASGTNRSMYSTDGITWTPTSIASASWTSVAYGDGRFVAVAPGGAAVRYSTDGITWTAGTTAAANSWYSVAYGNGTFVAVAIGTAGAVGTRIMSSVDGGATWTIRTNPADNSWNGVTFGNGRFVAVAYDGTQRAMYSVETFSGGTSDPADNTTRLFALDDTSGAVDVSFKPVFPPSTSGDYLPNYWGPVKITATTEGLAAFGGFTTINNVTVNNFAWFPNNGGC